MKKTLNPNAGEFHPNPGAKPLSCLDIGVNPSSTSQHQTSITSESSSFTKTPLIFTNDSVEARYFIPVTRYLMECRSAFYEHSETNEFKHLEFERLLRRSFFAAHEADELSISSTTISGQEKPFWLSYSTEYFLMAHDVIQEIELGTPYPVDEKEISKEITKTTRKEQEKEIKKNNENEETNLIIESFKKDDLLQRNKLREMYIMNVSPLIPDLLRKQLAYCAKRSSISSINNIKDAILYSLDIFFFFTRLQFLQFLDGSTGTSYSACVQVLTKLREHLLNKEIAEPFLNIVLVLILISIIHISSIKNKFENISNETISLKIKVKYLFCTYFPSLVVAFLVASPLQSMEELRYSFIAITPEKCLPILKNCSKGSAIIRETFSFNPKSAILWSATLREVITFCINHMTQTNCNKKKKEINFLLSIPSILDDNMHVQYPTTLHSLLNIIDIKNKEGKYFTLPLHQPEAETKEEKFEEEKEIQQRQQQQPSSLLLSSSDPFQTRSSRSMEFHRLAMEAASASCSCEHETLYFCLLALVNMNCFTPADLGCLFRALEDTCGWGGGAPGVGPLQAFLASPACAALTPAAQELLDVLNDLLKRGTGRHLRALAEVREAVGDRLLPQ